MTKKRKFRQIAAYVLGAVTAVAILALGMACTAEEEKEKIVFADLNWESAEIQTRIAGYILEHGYGYPVENVVADTTSQFPAFENDDVHVSMEVWVDNIEDVYNDAVAAGSIVPAGVTLPDNWQGWVIPQYVKDANPGLVSVSDIPDHQELFVTPDSNGKARFVTCIPGWGCELVNQKKIEAYDLGETLDILSPGSSAGLMSDLEGAYGRQEAWLGYMWAPTKVAGELDLYVLEEPPHTDECWAGDQGCAYPTVDIRIVVSKALSERAPEVVDFFGNWQFESKTAGAVEAWMKNNNETPEAAAVWYLNNNRDAWSGWVTSDAAKNIDEALAEG